MPRKLKLDLEDLAMVMTLGASELHHYLDTETGEVALVTDETRQTLEEIHEELDDQSLDAAAITEAARAKGLRDDDIEALLVADVVEEGFGSRFIAIPTLPSHDAYEDMEAFIATVRDRHIQDRLENAIQGRGAFRRFKDVLEYYSAERERWFAFRDARDREHVLEWLAEEEIEPLLEE